MAQETPSLPVALRSRRGLLATFQMLPRIEIVEMLALAGFDAVIIDLEHGPIAEADLPALAAAARGAGLFCVARLAGGADPEIAKALDTGVDGVMVPHVCSATEAARVAGAARFPPDGHRSLNPFVRGTDYGYEATAWRDANERVAVLAMIEGRAGLESADAICRTRGVDAVFVGPVDLSAAIGVPGRPEHPDVASAVASVFACAASAGIAGCTYAPTPALAAGWFAAGASLVAVSADHAMALGAFRDTRAAVTAEALRMSEASAEVRAAGS